MIPNSTRQPESAQARTNETKRTDLSVGPPPFQPTIFGAFRQPTLSVSSALAGVGVGMLRGCWGFPYFTIEKVCRIYQIFISCVFIDMKFISKIWGMLFNQCLSFSDPHLHKNDKTGGTPTKTWLIDFQKLSNIIPRFAK